MPMSPDLRHDHDWLEISTREESWIGHRRFLCRKCSDERVEHNDAPGIENPTDA